MRKASISNKRVDFTKTGSFQRYLGNFDVYVFISFFLYGLISQYFLLSVLSGITLIAIIRNLWKPYVPPVLLFFITFQWLQVFASVLYADTLGEKLGSLFGSTDLEFLFVMTFIHIMIMALFLKNFTVNKYLRKVNLNTLKAAAQKINTKNVIIGYFVSLVTLPLLTSIFITSPSMVQLIATFGIVKSVFIGLLIFSLLLKNTKNKWLIIGVLLFDFILSFTSFFSNFKVIIIMTIIIYLTVNPYIRKSAFYKIVPLIVLLLMVFSFWSYVKGGYREFLNQGSYQQVKQVSNKEALLYMYGQLSDFKLTELQKGASVFLKRLQYMERYSEVYERVPSVVKHQNGQDLLNAVEFITVPRFINRNKGVKDASVRTSYYTGKQFSSAKRGTSISMGYLCDLYIDFGIYLMVIPLLMIMTIVGVLYKKVVNMRRYNILFTYMLVIGSFMALGTFESDVVFFLGSIRNCIAFLVLGYFTFFPWLHRFIFNK